MRITDIKMKPISRVGHTLIRIDTDAGVSGYGESGVAGSMMKAWMEVYKPLLTGEKLEMPQGYYSFLKEQAVDFIYPDIAFCGGITAIVKIATLASLYRIPVATHNVGGILLTMSSIHFGLSIHDFLTSECRMDGRLDILAMAKSPPVVKGGFTGKPELPGLGVDLDDAGVKRIQGANDPPDWV